MSMWAILDNSGSHEVIQYTEQIRRSYAFVLKMCLFVLLLFSSSPSVHPEGAFFKQVFGIQVVTFFLIVWPENSNYNNIK